MPSPNTNFISTAKGGVAVIQNVDTESSVVASPNTMKQRAQSRGNSAMRGASQLLKENSMNNQSSDNINKNHMAIGSGQQSTQSLSQIGQNTAASNTVANRIRMNRL